MRVGATLLGMRFGPAAQAQQPAPALTVLRAIATNGGNRRTGRKDGLPPLLEVRDLHTEFRTGAGLVRAVDGVSYTVDPGETVAIVGESGSGKSVSALSLLRLIPDPPGRITAGEVLFAGRNLMRLSEEQMRQVRGGDIGMVFQEAM